MSRLPDFIIIGSMKCGTRSLSKNLSRNSRVTIVDNSTILGFPEFHFFNMFWDKGKNWYKDHFPDNGSIVGECTPAYIAHFDCHQRMYEAVPDAKLILLLRDPVFRAYSHYNHFLSDWPNSRSYWPHLSPNMNFIEAIKYEIKNYPNHVNGIISRGYYINQIESLLSFYPKESLLIIISERLWEKPEESYESICKFIGADYNRLDLQEKNNVGSYKASMPDEAKSLLAEIYRPYNERLFTLLEYKIENWL